MLASSLPADFTIPWANSAGVGNIRTIPTASQIGIQNGAASLTDGFPPDTMLTPGAGGVPPFGQDFNGILKWVTQCCQAMQAGFFPKFDGTLSTAIGGYWNGAVIRSNDGHTLWLSTADNNTNDPNSVTTNWTPLGIRTVFGRTGPAITAQAGDYTASQLGYSLTIAAPSWHRTSPDGWIEQGGLLASSTGSDFVDFPIVFPTQCLGILVNEESAGLSNSNCNAGTASTSGVTIYTQSSGRAVRWRAWGN